GRLASPTPDGSRARRRDLRLLDLDEHELLPIASCRNGKSSAPDRDHRAHDTPHAHEPQSDPLPALRTSMVRRPNARSGARRGALSPGRSRWIGPRLRRARERGLELPDEAGPPLLERVGLFGRTSLHELERFFEPALRVLIELRELEVELRILSAVAVEERE